MKKALLLLIVLTLVVSVAATSITHVDEDDGRTCGVAGEECQRVVTGDMTIDSCCEGFVCQEGECVKPGLFSRLISFFKGTPTRVGDETPRGNEPGTTTGTPDNPQPQGNDETPKGMGPGITTMPSGDVKLENKDLTPTGRVSQCCDIIACFNQYGQEFICQDGKSCYREYAGCHQLFCEPPKFDCPSCEEPCNEKVQTCYVMSNNGLATHVQYQKVQCRGSLKACEEKYGECECGWEETTCKYNGKEYKDGETFEADDGCNTCRCTDGKVICTLMACEEPCKEEVQTCYVRAENNGFTTNVAYKKVRCEGTLKECEAEYGECECGWTGDCNYNGKEYKNGEAFPAGDGCNECSCEDGKVTCTEKACDECEEKCQTCYVRAENNGFTTNVAYKKVQCCAPLAECEKEYGECECGWEEPTCTYNGKEYQNGETFPEGDGCNECTCEEGTVVCSQRCCGVVVCQVRDPGVTTHVAYKEVECDGTLEDCEQKYGECECRTVTVNGNIHFTTPTIAMG